MCPVNKFWEIFASIGEPFSRSDTIAVLVRVPKLAPFRMLAAKPAHLVISDPPCGTPRKAIALVFLIYLYSPGSSYAHAPEQALFDYNSSQAVTYKDNGFNELLAAGKDHLELR